MRFLVTVVCAAILLFLVYLFVGVIVDGYLGGDIVPDRAVPESWAAPNSWSEWRDIIIVALGLFWILAGMLTVALLVVLILVALAFRRLLKENAAPALDSLKDSLDNLRGTTEFLGETAVSPIIRMYSVVKGVRTGVSAVTHLPDRIRRRKKGKKK
jgi:hypothetical protein